MPAFAEYTAHPVFDEIRKSFDQVAARLESGGDERPISIRREHTGSVGSGDRTYRIESDDASIQVRTSVFPVCENLYEVYVDLEDGATARFTYNVSGEEMGEGSQSTFNQELADFLFDEIESRITPSCCEEPSDVHSPYSVPRVRLDREGTITGLSVQAQQVLISDSQDVCGRSIFSLVHQKNLRQVMRDLASMVAHGTKRAEWLLRLRTADSRWRWYRVVAQNELRAKDGILLRLHPVGPVEAGP